MRVVNCGVWLSSIRNSFTTFQALAQALAANERVLGFNPEEDRRRHTVSEGGVVVVAQGDDPYVTPISEVALRLEAEADALGAALWIGEYGGIAGVSY